MDENTDTSILTPEVDYLVCGSCQRDFPLQNIVLFMQHKKFDCDDFRSVKHVQGLPSRLLLCRSCPRKFTTPWRLLQHAQGVHALFIYMEEEFNLRRNQAYAFSSLANDISTSTSTIGIQTDSTTPYVNAHIKQSAHAGDVKTQIVSATSDVVTESNQFSFPTGFDEVVAKKFEHDNIASGLALNAPTTQHNMKIETKPDAGFAVIVDNSIQEDCVQPMLTSDNSERSNSDSQYGSLDTTGNTASVTSPNDECQLNTSQYRSSEILSTSVESCDNQAKDTKGSGDIVKDIDTGDVSGNGVTVKVKNVEIEQGSRCCDNQACGITLMPGTHEEPRKCCIAVVPKKRKRHMQTKHMFGRRKSGDRLKRSGDTNVIIDIDSSSDKNTSGTGYEIPQSCSVTFQTSTSTISSGIPISKEKSVIIEPGTTFSIPVPFSRDRTKVKSKTFVNQYPDFESLGSSQTSAQQLSGDTATHNEINEQGFSLQSIDSLPTTVQIGGVTYNLPRHKKRKYPTSKPFKCDQCEQAFNQRVHLRKHQSKHTGVKPFQCQQCDYSTVEKSHLKVHIRVHTGEKPFKCTYCEYATAQNSTLKIHLKRHHMRSDNNVTRCSDCGIDCESEDQLQMHVDQHCTSASQSATSV